jgi:hypothetical protein
VTSERRRADRTCGCDAGRTDGKIAEGINLAAVKKERELKKKPRRYELKSAVAVCEFDRTKIGERRGPENTIAADNKTGDPAKRTVR